MAEHTLALMLSMARSIPQASTSTKSGKWEKKKFLGNELRGKTLGVVGLGSIGREVVKRAKAFEMKVVAHDPYVSPQSAAVVGVQLLPLPELYKESDYITLHVALTAETDHMLNVDAFGQMKRGVRIVNCARGELIDRRPSKARWRRASLPAQESMFSKRNLLGKIRYSVMRICWLHLISAGSTEEAQEIVGVRIAEQLVEYLSSGAAINAVNMPSMTAEQYRALGPYADLADRLGLFLSHIATGNPKSVRLFYFGRIAENNTQLLRNAGLAGVLSRSLEHRANVVNAMQIANERGFTVVEHREPRHGPMDSIRIELETDAGVFAAEGAVVLGKPRLMQIEGISCEATLGGNLMYAKNEDVPGVIGYLGTVLGRTGSTSPISL